MNHHDRPDPHTQDDEEPLKVVGVPMRDGALTVGRLELRRVEDEQGIIREVVTRRKRKRTRRLHG